MNQARGKERRVAFFGGSFDPPHLGHLAVARAARDAFKLDNVLFAPVGAQPLKMNGSTASFEDRVELTRLAIADEPGFVVSLADAPKPWGVPNLIVKECGGLPRPSLRVWSACIPKGWRHEQARCCAHRRARRAASRPRAALPLRSHRRPAAFHFVGRYHDALFEDRAALHLLTYFMIESGSDGFSQHVFKRGLKAHQRF